MDVVGLVDCNSFYASAERVFRPDLKNRPIIVLSNNDGCVVARSAEAKALGIQMGIPAFQIKQEISRHKIAVFSSNYTLYADMSRRVMETLREFTPELEIYSIDECFLKIIPDDQQDLMGCGHRIRNTVRKYTGIPVSVGFGPTKALAKLANKISKKSSGVMDLTSRSSQDEALALTDIAEIWGVGRSSVSKLRQCGITTAKELRDAADPLILKLLTIVGVKLVHELRGIPAMDWEEFAPPKKGICVSRAFGAPVTTLDGLQQALATYIARAAEKLRRQHSLASVVTIFFHTNPFNNDAPFRRSGVLEFPSPTATTNEMIHCVSAMAANLYRPGYRLKKAGVILSGIVTDNKRQLNLFHERDRKRDASLMSVLDTINDQFGSRTLRFGAEGVKPDWAAKFEKKSPRYTTRWDELPIAR
ncbi:MAG: Y-family DNA polymerase [Planctomycetaceae bacterium]